ncbi:hypothetical protein GCM10008927_21500 [Amylibacter ulvae]|uniref:Uncharacterized protein n=1 Tax=Paramylibacter ulvae TaxID=1651968 RepID=A0ABQ3D363_9RHOB|nr:hypothetical protein [Amylibacter ulvae]GHA55275.1 hypothetical protein GCM10008927_21500 [Amylibacter ulvae]
MGLFDFLKRKKTPAPSSDKATLIVVQLNAKLQPLDRGEYFEYPLDDWLQEQKLGTVTGGGTSFDDTGIDYCDIELRLHNPTNEVITAVIHTLENFGAPKGSLLKYTDDRPDIPFGKHEGLAIYLNGTDLPDEVYTNSDVNEVIAQCDTLLGQSGGFRGFWQGERETALYFYGHNFVQMKSALDEYIKAAPLCEKSRLEQIA